MSSLNCSDLTEHQINENWKLKAGAPNFRNLCRRRLRSSVVYVVGRAHHLLISCILVSFDWKMCWLLLSIFTVHLLKDSVQFFTFSSNVGCSIAPCRINHPKKAAQSISNNILDTGMLWAAGLWQLKEANSFFVLIAIHASCCRLAPLIIQLNKLPIKQKVESRRARREQACQLQRARTCIDPVGFTPLNTSH